MEGDGGGGSWGDGRVGSGSIGGSGYVWESMSIAQDKLGWGVGSQALLCLA